MTQSILVKSTWDTLKERARLSTDVLAGTIRGLKSYWTDVGWTWPKSQCSTTLKCDSPLATLAGKLGRITASLWWKEGWESVK